MKITEKIPFPALAPHVHPAFLSYLSGGLSDVCKHNFRSDSDVRHRARNAAQIPMEPDTVQAIHRYNNDLGAPKPVLENIQRLKEGLASVVIAGQQPGLATGPLYTIYKAISAITLAHWLSEASGVPAIPVFWNHSDDHDTAEINETFLFKSGEGLASVRMGLKSGQTPAYLVQAGKETREVLRAFDEILPPTEHKKSVMDLLTRTRHDRPALWFSRLMMELFGSQGLVVVEPHLLDGPQAQSVFDKVMSDPSGMNRALEEGRQAIVSKGLPDQLGGNSGQLFRITGKKRARITGKEKKAGTGRFSAGAALRLMVQDTVFPTAAVVVGPSELAYCVELGPLYGFFDLDPPAFFPRISATLVEPRIRKVLERQGTRVEDVLHSQTPLVSPDSGKLVRLLEEQSGEAWKNWKETLDRVEKLLGENRPEVRSAREKTEKKIREALDVFQARLRSAQEHGQAGAVAQSARVREHLMPKEELQERRLNVFHFMNLAGTGFVQTLTNQLDPRGFEHQIVDME